MLSRGGVLSVSRFNTTLLLVKKYYHDDTPLLLAKSHWCRLSFVVVIMKATMIALTALQLYLSAAGTTKLPPRRIPREELILISNSQRNR